MNISDTTMRRPYQRASQESRREDLIKAALKLIGEGGPQAATVRAIADEAGVTAGLIRHYFQTKEELVRIAFQKMMDRMNADCAPPAAEDMPNPKHRLIQLIKTSITPPVAHPDSVGQWAGFLHLMRGNDELRAAYRESFLIHRHNWLDLIQAVAPHMSRDAAKRAAIAGSAAIEGLWLEAALVSDSFELQEIVAIGLSSVGAILGVELTKA